MNRFKIILLAFCGLFVGGLRNAFSTANAETATGTHEVLSRRADAAHTYTHLLVKTGSDNFHAAVAGAADFPIGSTTDSPAAAEDIFNVDPLTHNNKTRRLRCATALAADIDIYAAANGFVQGEPGTAGTYWLIGRSVALAVQEASSNYVIEVATHRPIKVKVVATPSTVADVAAGLASPALVKFL